MTADFEQTVELIGRAQDGEGQAVEALCRRYAERLRPLVRHRLGPELRGQLDETQDLVDSVMGDAFRDLERFEYRTEGSFLHWLSRILVHKIGEHLERARTLKRGGARKVADGSAAHGLLARQPDGGVSPSVEAQAREAQERLLEALDRMDEEQRDLVVLARIQGLDSAEIAEILDCTKDAARMRVRRALEALALEYDRTPENHGKDHEEET